MADLAQLSSELLKSINTPQLQSDPSYIAIISDSNNIIVQATKKALYKNVSLVPFEDEGLVLLLAKKEVYWRLATATAPNFDLETEFTKLVKSKRFDHYAKLIGMVQTEIDSTLSPVQVADVTMRSREGSARNYSIAKSQLITIAVSGETQNTANLDWNMFDSSLGNFSAYDIFVSRIPIYDPYSCEEIDMVKAEQRLTFFDIKRNKIRVNDLIAGNHYYITITFLGQSSKDYAVLEFDTLP